MFARVLSIMFVLYFMVCLVESKNCECISNWTGERCPGSGYEGVIAGYGHCQSYDNMLSGCVCHGCSTCDD